jgi:hypothetical protein
MSRRAGLWAVPVLSVAAVVLLLGLCLTPLVEAAPPVDQACAVVKGEQVGPSAKVAGPVFLAVQVEAGTLVQEPSLSGCASDDPTSDPASAVLSGDPSPRAPPVLS